jgi:putative PIN family toxin of toxin-antitoxin system
LKVLFDTNVLISAFLTEGLCSKILLRAKNNQFGLYTCPFIIDELKEKLEDKFSATKAEIKEAVTLIKEISFVVDPDENNITVKDVCRDVDDDSILACALAAEADYIVTGDPDLLTIKRYKAVKIVRPRDFELLFEN